LENSVIPIELKYFIRIRMSDDENSILSEPVRDEIHIKPPTSFVDKITLELLLNKGTYQKYLSKTDPEKHQYYQEFLKNIEKFRTNILEMTEELLENPKLQYTNEISETFDAYIQALIKYLEIEAESEKHTGDNDDILFPR